MSMGVFEALDPEVIFRAIEDATGNTFDGTVTPYPSYINRVYGLSDEEGVPFIAKFYRPGRWTAAAILEEHDFILDCHEEEIPVVPPVPLRNGSTLGEIELGQDIFPFAVFPKKAGRNFDAERDEDWIRLGSLIARVHRAGRCRTAPARSVCSPGSSSAVFVEELLRENLVHPDLRTEFGDICEEVLERIAPRFEGFPIQRIHGDCHRGNILDRSGEGLLLVDFDDMATGPCVQDLWLLLPGRAHECGRELGLLLEGYEMFLPFDPGEFALIEPLRFMRMLYFLVWFSRQRKDHGFEERFPGWGTRAFWIREIEDLREQAAFVLDDTEYRPQ